MISKKLKIALLAPLTRPPHPDTRGSRPRIVYDLAKYLIDAGHEVTTYAAEDAEIPGNLISVVSESVYNAPPAENPFYQHTIALAELAQKIKQDATNYDIIHNHVYPEFLPLLTLQDVKTPIITTPHLYLWPELVNIFKQFPKTYFVAIADYQQNQGKGMNFVDRVYNGIEVDEFEFNDNPQDYFLFFGRIKKFKNSEGREIDPKGVLDAIKACQMADEKLIIAGNVENPEFFEKEIKPQLNDKIKFVGKISAAGPIGFKEKVDLYKNAKGYFFLSHWDEGCPLGPLEAMACGTPVIANHFSSLPEIVDDKKTGFIVKENDLVATVEAMKNIGQINRHECRQHVEQKFSAKLVAQNYERVYQQILEKK